MYDSPSPRASQSTARSERQVRAEHPPRYTRGGFAVYATLAALTPVVLAAVAAPVVTAAAVAGLVVGALGTRLLARSAGGRPADRPRRGSDAERDRLTTLVPVSVRRRPRRDHGPR